MAMEFKDKKVELFYQNLAHANVTSKNNGVSDTLNIYSKCQKGAANLQVLCIYWTGWAGESFSELTHKCAQAS